jgi:hypothetical protein
VTSLETDRAAGKLGAGRRRGDFDAAALAGGREVDPAEFVDDREILGLRREGTYVWGTLRDDHGQPLSVMRRVPPAGAATGTAGAQSLGGRLIVMDSRDAGGLAVCKDAKNAASSDDIQRAYLGAAAVFSAAGHGRGRMRLETDGTGLRWAEEGVLDLSGHRVCSGLQWYLPGSAAALYYPTQTWLVDGTVLGRSVRGFIFVEEAYMLPGGRLYVDKDPLHDARYLTWYSWATRWDDGRTEIGHFLFGQGRFHVGLVADDEGRVRSAAEMDLEVIRSDGGYWHDGIRMTMDGQAWELVPDLPSGRMLLGQIPNPQQEGLMRRVGEQRRPEVWMAWGETVPANGVRRTG